MGIFILEDHLKAHLVNERNSDLIFSVNRADACSKHFCSFHLVLPVSLNESLPLPLQPSPVVGWGSSSEACFPQIPPELPLSALTLQRCV
jgi:hypothetical protein